MPTICSGVNGIAVKGCLYVFGGEGDDEAEHGVFKEVELYHPATDSWTQLEPFPIPVHGVTGAVFLDGLIYPAGRRRFPGRKQRRNPTPGLPDSARMSVKEQTLRSQGSATIPYLFWLDKVLFGSIPPSASTSITLRNIRSENSSKIPVTSVVCPCEGISDTKSCQLLRSVEDSMA